MISKKVIRRLIYEELEAEIERNLGVINDTGGTRNSPTSVNAQIDAFFLEFEQQSIEPTVSDLNIVPAGDDLGVVSEFNNSLSIYNLLFEQPEEEIDVEEEVVGDEGDIEVDEETETDELEPEGDEAQQAQEPEKPPQLNINIDEFTEKVVRLYKNPEALLQIQRVILNRAKNFLLRNHGELHAQRFLDNLRDNFGIGFGDKKEEIPLAPYAVGANPAGAGITAGGGG